MGEETLENRMKMFDMALIGVKIDRDIVDIHDDPTI